MKAPHREVPRVLLMEEGQKLCRAMRRETWCRLMTTSSDPTMRRLGAAIFVAAAMNELVPSRATWGSSEIGPRRERPATARVDRPRRVPCEPNRAAREPRLTADHIAEIRASSEMGRILAKRYGVSESSISRVRQGGVRANRSRLTLAEQAAIRASDESVRSLARHYGVSWTTVARLRAQEQVCNNTEACT